MPRIVVLTLFIFLILRGKCALECGVGQYLKEEACRECKSTCAKCISEFLCTKCIAGFFGETCTQTCHEGCLAKLCDKETGACLSCKKGYYQTETCEQCPENCTECHNADTCTNCKTGSTGNKCQKLCVNCQPDSACSLETGICSDGCKDEYSGYSCLEHCNSNCLSCDRVDATKCFACAKGKYGNNCEKPCPTKCVDNSCNKDTGSCLHGCLNGSLCSPDLETGDGKSYITIIPIIVGVVAGILVFVFCVTVYIKRRKARLSGRPQLDSIQSCAEGFSEDASEMCNFRYPVSIEENELPSNMGKQYGDQYKEETGQECESLLETCHEPSKETGPRESTFCGQESHEVKGQRAESSAEQTKKPPNQSLVAGRALATVRKEMPVVRVPLLPIYLALDIIKNIKRWWMGEISGKRCVKNIIDCGVSIAAGIVGGVGCEVVGAAFGAAFGPVGIVAGAIGGAVVGGVAATQAAHALCDRLTQWVFGLPKSEALEKAYSFMAVSPTASNSDINSRYRHLALDYHPDKGGNHEKWIQLQYSMAVIREARDEP